MSILLAGLLAGLIHVLSGPDHLAAIAPYATLSPRRGGDAWRVGFRWGIGHTGGVLLVGLLPLLLRDLLPIDALSAQSERVVGFVLIGIGLWGVRIALRTRLHVHEHEHDGGERHAHIHAHGGGGGDVPHDDRRAHGHSHAAFAVGTLHGLAGSSHLLGVLPALALPSAWGTALYLTAFGIGSVLGMTAFSFLLGMAAREFSSRIARAYPALVFTCSLTAVVVGGFWLFRGA